MSNRYTCGVYGSCAEEFITKVCGPNKNSTVIKTTGGPIELTLFKVEDIDSHKKGDMIFIIQITNHKDYTNNKSATRKIESFCAKNGICGYVYILGYTDGKPFDFKMLNFGYKYTKSLDNGVSAFDFLIKLASQDSVERILDRDYIAICGKSEVALQLANHDGTVYSDDPEILENYNITKIIAAPSNDDDGSYLSKIRLLKEKYPNVPVTIVTNSEEYHNSVLLGITVMRIPKNLAILTKQKSWFNVTSALNQTPFGGYLLITTGISIVAGVATYCLLTYTNYTGLI